MGTKPQLGGSSQWLVTRFFFFISSYPIYKRDNGINHWMGNNQVFFCVDPTGGLRVAKLLGWELLGLGGDAWLERWGCWRLKLWKNHGMDTMEYIKDYVMPYNDMYILYMYILYMYILYMYILYMYICICNIHTYNGFNGYVMESNGIYIYIYNRWNIVGYHGIYNGICHGTI